MLSERLSEKSGTSETSKEVFASAFLLFLVRLSNFLRECSTWEVRWMDYMMPSLYFFDIIILTDLPNRV